MGSQKLSRRQLLGGLWAGLVGCWWPGASRGSPPPPAPVPHPLVPARLPPLVTTYTYDTKDGLVGVAGPFPWAPPAGWSYGSVGGVTTYTYGGSQGSDGAARAGPSSDDPGPGAGLPG
jgi:hypothetical protein